MATTVPSTPLSGNGDNYFAVALSTAQRWHRGLLGRYREDLIQECRLLGWQGERDNLDLQMFGNLCHRAFYRLRKHYAPVVEEARAHYKTRGQDVLEVPVAPAPARPHTPQKPPSRGVVLCFIRDAAARRGITCRTSLAVIHLGQDWWVAKAETDEEWRVTRAADDDVKSPDGLTFVRLRRQRTSA